MKHFPHSVQLVGDSHRGVLDVEFQTGDPQPLIANITMDMAIILHSQLGEKIGQLDRGQSK